MRYLGLIVVVCSGLMMSATVEAAVRITEVAWMGTTASANHEWIELHNSGSAVDVTGWTVTDGNKLRVALTGTIAAGDTVLLERTSDASAPGAALVVYTGALSNSGATLTLADAAGTIVDQVAGGANWQSIGGDNATKDTAQRTSTGWVTAAPTPGRQLSGTTPTSSVVPAATSQTTAAKTATKSRSGSGRPAWSVVRRAPTTTATTAAPELQVAAPVVAYVNQPVKLAATPANVGRTIAASLRYEWNFGDGSVGSGRDAMHQFRYPGRYVVLVTGVYKGTSATGRHEIQILPVQVALARVAPDTIRVTNTGDTELALGGYRVTGITSKTIPPNSVVLPGESLYVPTEAVGVGAAPAIVSLYDQAGVSVATSWPHEALPVPDAAPAAVAAVPRPPTAQPTTAAPPRHQVAAPAPARFSFAADPASSVPSALHTATVTPAALPVATSAPTVAATTQPGSTDWPTYALVVVLLLGVGGVLLVPEKPPAPNHGHWM